jgi:hypothetical protein
MINLAQDRLVRQTNDVLTISMARSPEEKMEVYRFRYKIYVEEMGRKLVAVDHKNKMVVDELDSTGIIFYAHVGSEIVGTNRINIGTIKEFPHRFIREYALNAFKSFRKKRTNLMYTSKTMLNPAYRGSLLYYKFIMMAYEIYCKNEIDFSFAGCNPHIVPLLERLGYRRYTWNFTEPGFGFAIPLVYFDNPDHLRAVCSPFYRSARQRLIDPNVTGWFMETFPEAKNAINTQLVTEEELWMIISKKLSKSPLDVIAFLQKLTVEEASKFLRLGVIINCRRGVRLITANDSINELYILISGRLLEWTPDQRDMIIKPGQCFGETWLDGQNYHMTNVFPLTNAQVLAIPRQSFEKFCVNYPTTVRKIMDNLRPYMKNRIVDTTHIRQSV